MENRKYNSLFFDLDDTLLDYSAEECKAVLTVLEKFNMPHSPDVLELFDEINDWHTFELGKVITCFDVVTNRFTRLLKLLEVKGEQLSLMQNEFYKVMLQSHKLKSGTLKTLKYLKEAGYKLYITSNGYPEFQYKRIKASRIMRFFDGIFISEEIGYKKPATSFFDYVMNRIPESRREKVLIIGDAPTADILGGLNSKIDTCFVAEKEKKCKYNYTYKIGKITDLINLL